MIFDFVGLTIQISAVFNVGTGGTVPVVAPEKSGRSPRVTAITGNWALRRMSLILLQRR